MPLASPTRTPGVIALVFFGLVTRAFCADQGPEPGRWEVVPHQLVSGQTCPLEIRYIDETDLPPGTTHRILLEPLSVKQLVLAQPSTDLEIIPIPGVKLADVSLKTYPVHGIGYRQLEFTFPHGVKAGEGFAFKYGNKAPDGSIMALVDPEPTKDLSFETYTIYPKGTGPVPGKPQPAPIDWEKQGYLVFYRDALKEWVMPGMVDWEKAGWTKGLPKVDIVGGPATNVRVFAPSLVQSGKPFSVKMSVVDGFDNAAFPNYAGKVSLEAINGVSGLPGEVDFADQDADTRKMDNISIAKPGIYRLRASFPGNAQVYESNPIVVRDEVTTPIYWGCIHNHIEYSECWGESPTEFHRFCRDIAGMDYASLSDHRTEVPVAGGEASRLLRFRLGHDIDSLAAWKDTVDAANAYNKPGSYVTLVGYEWSAMDSDHYNIYFADTDLAHLDRYFTPHWTDFSFDVKHLLEKTTDALFIPHKHANVFPYLVLEDDAKNASGQPLTPCIEVYSDWGESYFPYGVWSEKTLYGGLRSARAHSYLWALDNGYILGLEGDSDCHAGWPGRRCAAGISPTHDHPPGLTAAITSDFSREGIMNAYRQRTTYATTGARIFLDVKANDTKMGGFLNTDKPFSISAEIAGTDVIKSIELYNGLQLVGKKDLGGKRDGTVVFDHLQPTDDLRGYSVAVIQNDENRAFSTPIWVRRESTPDLAWTSDDKGGVFLVNQGKGPATNVDVMTSRTENPFTTKSVEGRSPASTTGCAILWTYRKTDQCIVLYVRVQDFDINAKISLHGVKSYTVEPNADAMSRGMINNDDKGTIELLTKQSPVQQDFYNKVYTPHRVDMNVQGQSMVPGLSIQAYVDPDQPAYANIDFGQNLKIYFGDVTRTASRYKMPLNGRTSGGTAETKVIPLLAPGEKIQVGKSGEARIYSADPENKIVETDETNNGYTAK